MRLIYLTLGWVIGLLVAAGFPSFSPVIWIIVAIAALFAALILRGRWLWLFLAVFAFSIAGLRFSLVPQTSALAELNDSGGLTLEGIVGETLQLAENRYQFRMDVESVLRNGNSHPIYGAVLVQAPLTTRVELGEHVQVTGRLISPFVADRFSYAEYLMRQGITGILTDTAIESLAPPSPSLYGTLSQIREVARTIINLSLPEPASGLLIAILFGDETGIAQPVSDAFSTSGVAHVLAVSGFNMIVVASAVQATLTALRVRRYPAAIISLSIVLIYAMLAGATPAVMRAALMSMLLIAGTALRRKTFIPASLAFSLILLTLINPLTLWDAGWQLSFFTVLALSQFAAPIAGRLNQITGLLPTPLASFGVLVTEPLATTLAAQIAALPIIALYFGTISLVAPIVNLLVVPVQPAIMLFGVLGLITASIMPLVAQLWFWCAGVLLMWTANVARIAANLPFAEISISVSPKLVALYFIVWIGWSIMSAAQPEWYQRFATAIRSRTVYSAAGFAAVCILVLLGTDVRSRPDGNLHIWFLDMEGKNAILMQTPSGAQILIDGGDMPSRLLTALGDRLPFKDQEIDLVVATQPDTPNIGALPEVLSRYTTGALLTNGQPNLGDVWQSIIALSNANIHPMQSGNLITLSDGLSIEVVNPHESPDLGDSLDNSSLVLRVDYGDVSLLFPGDLSTGELSRLVEEGSLAAVTVLQVPHPASEHALDQQIVSLLQPDIAIVQHSATNQRDNPSPQTLSFLDQIPLYSTADGTVHLWTDGDELWVEQER